MADEKNESTKTYVLAADGMRLKGRRYRRGDEVQLPAEQGDRLVESGSLVENKDDLPDQDTSGAPTAGLGDVADESSTLYASQTLEDDGETIKPESFGHPDQVEAAEKEQAEQAAKADATKPAATRRRGATTGATTARSGGEQTPARGAER